jgi:hypothetical protein
MNQLTLNLVAISIFLMTMSVLLGPIIHIPPAIPALTAFAILGLGTLDTVGWQGQGQVIFLDWLSRFSPEYRSRVIRHEAGHFLVAQSLGIPVVDYSLNAWQAFRKGFGGQGGVQVDTQSLEQQMVSGESTAQWIDRYCMVWMAGIAAEQLIYGEAQGGQDDRFKLQQTLMLLNLSPEMAQQKERWATLQAKGLLKENQTGFDALTEALTKQLPLEECIGAIGNGIPAR